MNNVTNLLKMFEFESKSTDNRSFFNENAVREKCKKQIKHRRHEDTEFFNIQTPSLRAFRLGKELYYFLFFIYSSAFSLARATRFAVSGCEENIFWNLDSFGASAESSNSLFKALYMAYGSRLCLMQNSKP